MRDVLAPRRVLRASINLGNPVLAQGDAEQPRGVTVDLARAIADALGVPLELVCFDAARHSFEALTSGRVDVAFLAVEPARAEQVAFTPPYVVIDGVYVVPEASSITSASDVDRPGLRIGVKRGSAYDLFLTRTLEHAELVRGDEGVDVYLADGLDVGAGIRQPVQRFVAQHSGQRVVTERFMQIRQAVALPRSCPPDAVGYVADLVERRRADGSIASWLRASGQPDAEVAPPAA
ncbi:transporter substrate-binding domain-containing protein [Jatrophihabitans endophyticus]|uniref:transporter substrate-binding domain-containing protein n=1 Tax=Jatrophihabitans endophyticus TaxID=1206085 RepID=UPI0011610237|nr:transporter substrate-binding domain-containing protein [Jatrophihabitans endophyticus]